MRTRYSRVRVLPKLLVLLLVSTIVLIASALYIRSGLSAHFNPEGFNSDKPSEEAINEEVTWLSTTVFVPGNLLPQLIARNNIVIGEVGEIVASGGRTSIPTGVSIERIPSFVRIVYEVEVTDVLKGSESGKIYLIRYDFRQSSIPSTPITILEPGEELLLFLARENNIPAFARSYVPHLYGSYDDRDVFDIKEDRAYPRLNTYNDTTQGFYHVDSEGDFYFGFEQLKLYIREHPGGLADGTTALESGPKINFADTRQNTHRKHIEQIARIGITRGCDSQSNTHRFCPNRPITRAEMATFLVRTLNLPETINDSFTDDNSNVHEDAINRMAVAGITQGCQSSRTGSGNRQPRTSFCPDREVSRAEMATFLTRAFHLDKKWREPGLHPEERPLGYNREEPEVIPKPFEADPISFSDISSTVHAGNIQILADEGITRGCSPPTDGGSGNTGSTEAQYCPERPVTRGEMATLLMRSIDYYRYLLQLDPIFE